MSPDPPLIGQYANYSAEVYDPDGSIQYTNLSLSGVCSLSDEKRTGTTPSWDGLCTPSGEGWLNATFETVDDAGAVTTTQLNRLLEDTAPDVTVNEPVSNQNVLTYDVPYNISVNNTGDSVPNENITCTQTFDNSDTGNTSTVTTTVSDPATFTGTEPTDLGQITYDVSCADDAGNTNSTSPILFDVQSFDFNNVDTTSPVSETETVDFTYDITWGDMVENVDNYLWWQNERRDTVNDSTPSGNEVYTFTHETPLVTNNDTTVTWVTNSTVNISEFQSGYETTTASGQSVQDVYHSYFLNTSSLDPTIYSENRTYNFEVRIRNTSAKADLLATDTYYRFGTQSVLSLDKITATEAVFRGGQDVGAANTFESREFNVSGETKVSFQDRERFIQTSNSTLTVQTIKLTDCSGSGDPALRFETYDELNISEAVFSDIEFSVRVTNQAGQSRVYNFTSRDKKQHTFCIKPGNAEYTVDMLNGTQLQYDEGNSSSTKYAERSYWIIDEQINNQSITTIPLYLLEQSQSQSITFEVRDSSNEPFSGVYGRINKYYPGLDNEITVAMFRTGSEGQDRVPVDTSSNDRYRFLVFEDKDLIWETTRQSLVESPKVITVEDEGTPTYYERIGQYSSSCSTANTYVNCSYVSSTEALQNASLTVNRQDFFGTTTVCTSSAPTLSGRLVCNGLNATSNKYTYSLTASEDDVTFEINSGTIGTVQSDFGATGVFAALVLILSLAFAGLYDPRAAVALSLVGVVASALTNLIAVTTSTLISVVVVGLIVLWRIR